MEAFLHDNDPNGIPYHNLFNSKNVEVTIN